MDRFENSLFSSIGKENYNILWVEHLDKGRLELNYVIPKIHLNTGRQLHVYSHRADMPLTRSFKRLVNHEYGFSEPEDPERKRGITEPQHIPRNVQVIRKKINNDIEKLINNGEVKNRADIVQALEASGYKIKRITKNAISIENPNGKKNIRLLGANYEESFKQYADLASAKSNITKTMEFRRDYKQQIRNRIARNSKRYKTIRDGAAAARLGKVEGCGSILSVLHLSIPTDNSVRTPDLELLKKPTQIRLNFYERDRENIITKVKSSIGRVRRELNRYAKSIASVSRKLSEFGAAAKRNIERFGQPHRLDRAERIERLRQLKRQQAERSNNKKRTLGGTNKSETRANLSVM